MSTTDLTKWPRLVARAIAHNAQPQETQSWVVSRTRSASNETPHVAPRTDPGPTTPARDLRPGRAVWTSTPVVLKYNGPSALGSAVFGRLPLWTFPIRTS